MSFVSYLCSASFASLFPGIGYLHLSTCVLLKNYLLVYSSFLINCEVLEDKICESQGPTL